MVYVCSNAECRAVHDTDPQGHCPACKLASGVGWSTMGVDPDERCRCGDPRKDHQNYVGRCKKPDDLTHGFRSCNQFQPL